MGTANRLIGLKRLAPLDRLATTYEPWISASVLGVLWGVALWTRDRDWMTFAIVWLVFTFGAFTPDARRRRRAFVRKDNCEPICQRPD